MAVGKGESGSRANQVSVETRQDADTKPSGVLKHQLSLARECTAHMLCLGWAQLLAADLAQSLCEGCLGSPVGLGRLNHFLRYTEWQCQACSFGFPLPALWEALTGLMPLCAMLTSLADKRNCNCLKYSRLGGVCLMDPESAEAVTMLVS